MLWASILYIALVLLLTWVIRAAVVERTLLLPFRATLAAAASSILNLLGIAAVAHGASVVSPTLRAEVVNECTGIEAVILLVPAMLAFPSSWRAKIAGMALGFGVMTVLNFLRVVSLCYVGTFSGAALHTGHLYVWPVAVIVAALVTLLVWVERIAVPLHH